MRNILLALLVLCGCDKHNWEDDARVAEEGFASCEKSRNYEHDEIALRLKACLAREQQVTTRNNQPRDGG